MITLLSKSLFLNCHVLFRDGCLSQMRRFWFPPTTTICLSPDRSDNKLPWGQAGVFSACLAVLVYYNRFTHTGTHTGTLPWTGACRRADSFLQWVSLSCISTLVFMNMQSCTPNTKHAHARSLVNATPRLHLLDLSAKPES